VTDSGVCDVLILDASYKQSLATARRLGRAGLRVALGESEDKCGGTSDWLPAFRSRYSACNLVLPSYASAPDAFAARVIEFAGEHGVRVVIPTGDATIAAMAPNRAELAGLDCTLALAPDAALEIANDKTRTLELADQLGIAYPRSIQIDGPEDLPTAVIELGFPFVLKPTISWTGTSDQRVVPVEVVNKAEALEATRRFLDAGAGVIAQEWARGRREGVSLFLIDGEVLASCGHVAHRTDPPLGGVSIIRESIPIATEVLDASVRLAKAIGIEGPCEVEFRRDAAGRPLLMEVNARLAGTLENALQSGVNFPLMTWQWASGQPVQRVGRYRTGVRTRWLQGDIRWLLVNRDRAGRPDSVSRLRGAWLFASEFARTVRYDYFDWRDPRPYIAELLDTAVSARSLIRR
jgi:predicted ATP-grasp superfamily ATP-dependent carboligase